MTEQHPAAPPPEQPASPPNPPQGAPPAQPAGAQDTSVLPTQAPAAAPPGWTAAPHAAAPAPPEYRAAPGASAAPRGWWGRATSTGGGRAALVAVAVLGTVLLVSGIGLVAALAIAHDRYEERGYVTSSRGDGPGNGMGWGKGNGNGNGKNNGNGRNDGDDDDTRQLPGMGMGMGRGAAGLGAALHGEFTTDVTGTPTVMVVQTGEVTAYTAGTSLTVKSTDGFEATYSLDAATAASGRGGTQLGVGSQVRVLAAKEGMKVTALVVLR